MRRLQAIAALGLLALVARAEARAAEPDVGAKVDVSAVPLERAVAAGATGTAHLVLLFKGDASHHWGAPLKVVVTASAPVTPAKKLLGREDAVAPDKGKTVTRLEFAIPFTAAAKGDGTLSALVSMFVCTETVCDSVDRTVTWKVRAE